jgi:hypothetical protein
MVVPQSLLAELAEEHQQWQRGVSSGLQRLVKQGDGVGFHDIPAEIAEAEAARVASLQAWVTAHCEVEPRPVSSFGPGQEELRRVLGASSFDSLALARELHGTIYADDLGLRAVARNEDTTESFSTYALLHAATAGGRLTAGRCDTLVIGLMQRNYFFVPVTPRLFETAFRASHFAVDRTVVDVIDRLADKDVVTEAALAVLADVLRWLAVTVGGVGSIGILVAVALEALTRHRPRLATAQRFLEVARTRLRLLPAAEADVSRVVRAFLERQANR